ncbi:EcsC family protein [Enterobacter mori]|uniref:EcsC family protein n=1 Tax=Enterobacter mori TaxID=539813 RepID=UPI002ED1FA50|nr:EcsC family protein [Enterobacter mori]
MKNPLTADTIHQALEWAYDKAVNSTIPGVDNAQTMALSYMAQEGSITERTNSLIRWQNTKAGASGFVTGLGGAITLPVVIPANITSVLFIQIRMIAAIAHMGGHDLRNDQVKTMVYVCLCGNAAGEVLKSAGVKIGTKLTEQAIRNISGAVLTKINQAVGFRLLTQTTDSRSPTLWQASSHMFGFTLRERQESLRGAFSYGMLQYAQTSIV